jgi:hypothetical protein
MANLNLDDPKEKAKQNLIADYGADIDKYLKQLEESA